MKTWLKYVIAFFSFVLLLTAFIFVFGPNSYRAGFQNNDPSFVPSTDRYDFRTPRHPSDTQ
jgi:hypothetical protein